MTNGTEQFSPQWRLAPKGWLLLIIVAMLMGGGLLAIARWWQGSLDFSDPKLLSVRIKDPDGKDLIVKRVNVFADDFEHGIERRIEGWHQQMKLSSNSNAGNSANLIETTSEQVHSGKSSLKTYTPRDSLDLQKAALLRELFFFPPGSDCWFSAWFFIPGSESIENLFISTWNPRDTTELDVA